MVCVWANPGAKAASYSSPAGETTPDFRAADSLSGDVPTAEKNADDRRAFEYPQSGLRRSKINLNGIWQRGIRGRFQPWASTHAAQHVRVPAAREL
jgi:hypothetical protein